MREFPLQEGKRSGLKYFIASSVSAIALLLLLFSWHGKENQPVTPPAPLDGTQPLVMKGGDPYIRALMRTISASEANDRNPYSIIYGGKQISDLSRHPELCVPIVVGPNVGRCSTAAGRYQFLNTTWAEKAKRYHPRPPGMMFWLPYSFEAQYQDAVVHDWLSDSRAWGVDISTLLREGKVDRVFQRLSGTWTSLGYGIETNSMSRHLPNIYQRVLQEELQQAKR